MAVPQEYTFHGVLPILLGVVDMKVEKFEAFCDARRALASLMYCSFTIAIRYVECLVLSCFIFERLNNFVLCVFSNSWYW